MEYKQTKNPDGSIANMIKRISDNAFIPFAPDNIDYQAYLIWLSEGNTPEPADIPPAPTYQQLRAAAYPPIGEQLGALWKGGEAQAAMALEIQAVKDSVPKT